MKYSIHNESKVKELLKENGFPTFRYAQIENAIYKNYISALSTCLYNYTELREWFSALYEILLGQKQGPRMGSFIAIYGCEETRELINKAIQGKL